MSFNPSIRVFTFTYIFFIIKMILNGIIFELPIYALDIYETPIKLFDAHPPLSG